MTRYKLQAEINRISRILAKDRSRDPEHYLDSDTRENYQEELERLEESLARLDDFDTEERVLGC